MQIDPELAIYAKVTVKKTVPQGSTKPTLQVKPQTPVVRKGSDLQQVFQYCPYAHYGAVASFSNVLCENSRDNWYRKQKESGTVNHRIYSMAGGASNPTLLRDPGQPPAIFVQDVDANVLLFGFTGLSREQIIGLKNLANATQASVNSYQVTDAEITALIAAIGATVEFNSGPIDATRFVSAATTVLVAINSCTRCDIEKVKQHYRDRLDNALRQMEGNFWAGFNGIMAEVQVASIMYAKGWQIIDFSKPNQEVQQESGGLANTEIDIIANKYIEGLGQVVAFVEVKSGGIPIGMPVDEAVDRASRIIDQLNEYAKYAASVKASGLVPADMYPVVLIMGGATNPTVAQGIANVVENQGLPIVVIYCVEACDKPALALFNVAWSSNTTEIEARKIACELYLICLGADGQLHYIGPPEQYPFLEEGDAMVAPEPVSSNGNNCKKTFCLQ